MELGLDSVTSAAAELASRYLYARGTEHLMYLTTTRVSMPSMSGHGLVIITLSNHAVKISRVVKVCIARV